MQTPGTGRAASAATLVGVLLAGTALTLACSSARRGENVSGPFALDDPASARGETAFMTACHKCHPGGEAGLGPSLNDKPLPGFLVRFQIRHGLGAMPAFPEEALDDQAVDDVITYLAALRDR